MRNYTWEIDILWSELENFDSYKIFCVCPGQLIFELGGFNPYLKLMIIVPNISHPHHLYTLDTYNFVRAPIFSSDKENRGIKAGCSRKVLVV